MAITKDHKLWGWGWNERGSVGMGDKEDVLTPKVVLEEASHVAAGWAHTMVQKVDGRVFAWGYNLHGQVGGGGDDDQISPVEILQEETVKAIGVGSDSSWAITKEGKMLMWGSDTYDDRRSELPIALPFFLALLPLWWEYEWRVVCRWVFLGREDGQSPFSWWPVEVVYHVVGLLTL
jgi:alpha-tubulin suppressor-like RCC1 family protein